MWRDFGRVRVSGIEIPSQQPPKAANDNVYIASTIEDEAEESTTAWEWLKNFFRHLDDKFHFPK